MVAMTHGRGQIQYVELGLKRDGTIVGLAGADRVRRRRVPGIGAFLPFLTRSMAPGRVPDPEGRVQRQERGHEHDADRRVPRRRASRGRRVARAHHRHGRRRAGHRPGRDPQAELPPPEEFPLTTVTGANYDVGGVRQGARRGVPRRRLRRAAARAGAAARARRREAARHRRLRVRRGDRGRACSRSTARSRCTTTAPSPRPSAPRRTARATRPRSR